MSGRFPAGLESLVRVSGRRRLKFIRPTFRASSVNFAATSTSSDGLRAKLADSGAFDEPGDHVHRSNFGFAGVLSGGLAQQVRPSGESPPGRRALGDWSAEMGREVVRGALADYDPLTLAPRCCRRPLLCSDASAHGRARVRFLLPPRPAPWPEEPAGGRDAGGDAAPLGEARERGRGE